MAMQRRWLFPLCFGIVDTALMLWDIHNQLVIISVGMGWDTGAPPWPYQTPDTLLFAMNMPAYLIAVPIERALRLFVPWHYFVLFPAFLVWWSLAGYALDIGICKGWQLNRIWQLVAACCAVAFTIIGLYTLRSAISWWMQYSREVFATQNLIMLRLCVPGVWCLVFAAVAAAVAKKRIQLAQ